MKRNNYRHNYRNIYQERIFSKERILSAGELAAQLLFDLLYPPRCPVCETILPVKAKLRTCCGWRELVCSRCAEDLPWIRDPVCKKCGKPFWDDSRDLCRECVRRNRPYLAGRCVMLYRGSLRDSVLRMKFHNHREYLDFYAAAMEEMGNRFLRVIRPETIIPVPMNRRKRRARGFDQCRILAEKLSGRTGIPSCADALVRTRNTRPQKGLDREQRQANVLHAFAVKDASKIREPVLLIDDILTSSSTMEACALALREAGIREIYYLVLCTGGGKPF